MSQTSTSSFVDNTFTMFALKFLLNILKKRLHYDERNWMHWLSLFVARIIKPQLIYRLQKRFFEINALSFSFEMVC